DERLARVEERIAGGRVEPGHVLVGPALGLREVAVAAGDDPRRRALVEVEVGDLGLDGRDDLDRRGARADDRDALPGDVVRVVPRGGVEDLALEAVPSGDVRRLG